MKQYTIVRQKVGTCYADKDNHVIKTITNAPAKFFCGKTDS